MEISNRLVEASLRYMGEESCLTNRIAELEALQKISLYCSSWKEKLMYTSQLWNEIIEPDTTVAELLYGNEPAFNEDGRRFFQEMLEKSWQEIEDNPVGSVELPCSLGQYANAAADMEQYIELRQKCLDEIRDPKEYTEFMRSCFPHSIFAEGVDDEFLHIKDFTTKRREITKCLVVLDKEAIDLYLKYYNNIKIAMDYLTTKLNTCAPDGHDEKVSFTFEYDINDGDRVIKKKKVVNCSLHLKLIRDDSNLRIYFRWKDDEVAGGNKVLIGRVGDTHGVDMSDKFVTIVCCYNDSAQYRRLVDSLAKQDMEYELIGIDNREQQYDSCSSALNSVLDQIKTEYVIFSHQDIELPERDMLRRFVCFLQETGDADILGVAGAVDAAEAVKAGWQIPTVITDGTYVVANVCHGEGLEMAGEIDFSGIQTCDSVDECFFGGHTEFFRAHPFDETLCDNWHLYAVERCLYTRTKGNNVYVCDLPLMHHSAGKISSAYNRNFLQIAKRYAGRLPWVRTVCGSAGTDWIHRTLFYLKREVLIRMGRF